MQIVIGATPHIQPAARSNESQLDVLWPGWQSDPRDHRHLSLLRLWRFDAWTKFLFEVLSLQLFFELTEGRFHADAGGEDVDIGFDLDRRQRTIAIVVDVVD